MTGARYHKVFTRLWSSPGFRSAPDDVRLAWVYLLTCRHRTSEGLFVLPVPLAAHELAWPADRTRTALEALEGAGFIAVDPATDLVWLVNAVAWNIPKGPKQLKGAVNALAELPESFLRAHYLVKCREVCPELAAAIASELRWPDTPSIPLRYLSDSSSSSSSSSSNSSSSAAPPQAPPDTPPAGPDPELLRVVDLTDGIVASLGIVDAIANEGERRLVARALARGWTTTHLLDAAYDVAGRDDIDRPRAYLGSVLTRMANTSPPTDTPAPAATERRGALYDERPPCATCGGSGMVGGIGDDGRPEDVTPCPDCHVLGATA